MIKKILGLSAILALSANVFAGGDDRDTGPIEPIFDKVVVQNSAAKTMTLTPALDESASTANANKTHSEPLLMDEVNNKVVKTPSGEPITVKAHYNCKGTLFLSNVNVEKFKTALAGNFLYNTGPFDELGTEFSPSRWDSYFDCVANNQ